jgi:hypothetical protein
MFQRLRLTFGCCVALMPFHSGRPAYLDHRECVYVQGEAYPKILQDYNFFIMIPISLDGIGESFADGINDPSRV